MEREALSSNLLFDKIIIGIIGCLFLFVCIKSFSTFPWIFLIGAPILGMICYLTFFLPDDIEYDDGKMYVTRKNETFEVDFSDIYLIKMTSVSVGHRNLWKIKYRINNEEKSARFYKRYFSIYFNDFVKLVKAKNPNLTIVNWAWSFDF